jgi:hypothetical protein
MTAVNKFIIISILMVCAGARADDFLRDANGTLINISQEKALKACTDQNKHLPTARELAGISQSMGAKGISATNGPGYYLVSALNPDGKIDRFYFNPAGYDRPRKELAYNWFWSSSLTYPKTTQPQLGYSLGGYIGQIGLDVDDENGAVICLPGP